MSPDVLINDARLAGIAALYRRLDRGGRMRAAGLTFERFAAQHARFDELDARQAIHDEAARIRRTPRNIIRRLAYGRA